ncbi:hypothetical protein ACWDRB_02765 [Nonomuraea sp. NPDC003707]
MGRPARAGHHADRALELSRAGEYRPACHLAQLAGDAAPEDRAVHTARAEVKRPAS